ncbi:YczE/YyaS/YitT family protein [Halalkalibacillus halophilus]|uniref:YczE/YyaS/YitT family protein n=1 Tax=Halalkalibacillus halophilus TaxID=392827 RepID=UPI000417E6AB|nr:YitT family protein [Halalkalibacillus halophilus]
MKDLTFSVVFYLLGMATLSFGISMLILSDLGVGAWDALFVGLFELLGLTVGSWIFIVGILLIILNSYLLREKFDFSAIITIFLIGIFIDFWVLIVFDGVILSDLVLRTALLTFGIMCMGAGIAMYLQFNYAKNPIDNLMMAVHYRTGKSLAFSKSSIEIVILIIAFIIGGPIGVGTFIIAFGIGPLVQFFYKRVSSFKTYLVQSSTH